jgi:putative Ca2+/H+ antiporter (TMEM165/GDT1 family)
MLKAILTTFLLVFLAELGDKTQLSTMILASRSQSIWWVFAGAVSALVLSTFLGVVAGAYINRHIPQSYIQIGSGAAFLVIGILLLAGKL